MQAYATLRLGFIHWYMNEPKVARAAFDNAAKLAQQVGASDVETAAKRALDAM